MRKRIMALFLALATVAAPLAPTMPAMAAETGRDFETAWEIDLNEEVSRTVYFKSEKFKFSLPSSGYLEITGEHSGSGIDFEIWCKTPQKTDRVKSSKVFLKKEAVKFGETLTKGDYYLSVYSNELESKFSFKMSFTPNPESFPESGFGINNDFDSASKISFEKTYKAQLATNDYIDYYTFDMETKGKAFISVDSSVDLKYAIFNEQEREVISKEYRVDPATGKLSFVRDEALDAGTYYVRILINYYSSDVSPYGPYSFTLSKKDPGAVNYINLKSLTAKNLNYNGKNQSPQLTVKDAKGKAVAKSGYTVEYNPKNVKKVGKYTVTITGKGNYKGSVTGSFFVYPASTGITSLTPIKNGFTVKYKKNTADTTGYQIQYATDKSFKNPSSIMVKKNTVLSQKIDYLLSKKTFYVRIRTYKDLNGMRLFSDWSSVKSVKTK